MPDLQVSALALCKHNKNRMLLRHMSTYWRHEKVEELFWRYDEVDTLPSPWLPSRVPGSAKG